MDWCGHTLVECPCLQEDRVVTQVRMPSEGLLAFAAHSWLRGLHERDKDRFKCHELKKRGSEADMAALIALTRTIDATCVGAIIPSGLK